MPPWPTDDLATTHFDAGSDSPADARPILKKALDYLKAIIGARGSADGVCELDANAKVPPARIRRGEAGGTAPLDANAKVPNANLPKISPPNATTAVKGIVELADTAEATAGADTERAATPNGVKAILQNNITIEERNVYSGSGSKSRATGKYTVEIELTGAGITFVHNRHYQRYTPPSPSPSPGRQPGDGR